jgi:hypothetical protein
MSVFSLFWAAAALSGAAAEVPSKSELLDAWHAAQQRRPTLVVHEEEDKADPTSPTLRKNRFEFRRSGDEMCFVDDRVDFASSKREERHDCWVVNEHYAFVVRRPSTDHDWVLMRFAKVGSNDYEWYKTRLAFHEALSSWRGGVVADSPLSDILSLTKVSLKLRDEDAEHCELKFEQDDAKQTTTRYGFKFQPTQGTIVLGKQRQWCVESARLTFGKDADSWEKTIECRYDSETDILPREQVSTWSGGSDVSYFRLVEVDYGNRFSAGDFRLTAFGLPEPEGVPAARSNRVWYVGVVAVALIFSGVWLLRRRGRG